MIRCIAVDDEPLALNLVKSFISRVPFLELVDTCESAYEAMNLLQATKIDLMLLDVNMPDLTGIQLLKSISNPPAVILTTAYEEYALEGYELNVIDYLLKPFSFERFLKAVNKLNKPAMQEVETKTEAVPPGVQTDETDDYVLVRVEHNIIRVNLKDIRYIEGYKDYIKIYAKEEKPILTIKSMKGMEEILEKKPFMRVHRSYIVSLAKIDSIRNNRIMIGKKNIPVGENYREAFQNRFMNGKI